jgi:hypothetical protein
MRSRVTKYSLKDADKARDLAHFDKLRGRVALVLE